MPQALEEYTVSVLVIEIERHLAHHRIEVDKFARLRLELVREAVLKLLLKLIGAVRRWDELNLRVDPLHDYMHALAVQLLRAPELEVGEALFEPLANMNILKLLLDQIARILNQIQRYLEIASINQLVENGHGLFENVKLLNLLLGPGGYHLATL